ncbi:MAG TPA: DUF5005 domain-containing protein, partial [Bacteroidales bacterium]|nr:DUF5005 domain-containing protein [Bacteroidales bacterium]
MKKFLFLFFILFSVIACKGPSGTTDNKQAGDTTVVEPDTAFTALFRRNCCGFTGGDGTYSVRLPDGRTVWIFGDTFVGKVYPDSSRERRNPIYIRNSFVVQDGDSLHTLYHHVNGKDASEIIFPYEEKDMKPATFTEDSAWFWPGDGLIENGKLKVFLSSFIQADTGMWGFKWTGTWLATFSLPGMVLDSLYKIPYSLTNQVHYGHAVCEGNDFTYIYGAGEGRPYVARYAAGNVDGPWTFYDGGQWSGDPLQTKPMGDFHVSEQFSVSHIGNRYVLISQEGMLSNEIYSYVSDNPYGPWDQRTLIYKTPIPEGSTTIFTYNALAHPEFLNADGLLVSYNMNSSV